MLASSSHFLLDRRCTGESWVAFFSRSSGRRPDKVRTVYVFVSSVGPDRGQALQRFKYYLRGAFPVLAAAGSLHLRFLCRLRPGWFPVPDSVTEAVLRQEAAWSRDRERCLHLPRTFITSAIKAGQDEVFRCCANCVACQSVRVVPRCQRVP